MACLACEKGVPKRGRRRCPLCRRSFRSGWEGIETHWRARHAAALAYERFWSSLCREHKAKNAADCPSCRKGIPRSRKWPRQCPECAQVFERPRLGGHRVALARQPPGRDGATRTSSARSAPHTAAAAIPARTTCRSARGSAPLFGRLGFEAVERTRHSRDRVAPNPHAERARRGGRSQHRVRRAEGGDRGPRGAAACAPPRRGRARRSWITASTPTPARRTSSSTRKSCSWWPMSRWAAGSSSSSTRGSCARPRASVVELPLARGERAQPARGQVGDAGARERARDRGLVLRGEGPERPAVRVAARAPRGPRRSGCRCPPRAT